MVVCCTHTTSWERSRGNDPTKEWMQVEGVENELPKFLCGATLADLGDCRA